MSGDGARVVSAFVDVGATTVDIIVAVAFLETFTHECTLEVLTGTVGSASTIVSSALVDINASVVDDVVSSITATLIARVRVDTFFGCRASMSSTLAQTFVSIDALVVLVDESIGTWLVASSIIEYDTVVLNEIIGDQTHSELVGLRVLSGIGTEVVDTEETIVVVVIVDIGGISEGIIESAEWADGVIIGVKDVNLDKENKDALL